jgi:hypothetical protein
MAAIGSLLCVCGCDPPAEEPAQRPAGPVPEPQALADLLGGHLEGAKIVATRTLGSVDPRTRWPERRQIVGVDLKSGQVTVLVHPTSQMDLRSMSRPYWSQDGKWVVFSHSKEGNCWIVSADGTQRRRVLEGDQVFSPSFWRDPRTGEDCIVYKTRRGHARYQDDRGRSVAGRTILYRLSARTKTELFDFGCDGGLSPDGTHLGEAYRGCMIVDLADGTPYLLFEDEQACQASISPDHTYRLMHLYVSHKHIAIRDKRDRLLWELRHPAGSRKWGSPRWSNHPRYCAAVAKYGYEKTGVSFHLVVIHIDTKDIVVLRSLGEGWSAPHLWLPSTAEATTRPAAAGG